MRLAGSTVAIVAFEVSPSQSPQSATPPEFPKEGQTETLAD
jgi:hypothetical protein